MGLKKIISAVILSMVCFACVMAQTVEVKYFHGKQRCTTCIAIEKCTNDLLAEMYQRETKDGKVKMQVIDIASENGAEIAKEYKVSWSSLYIVKGKERKDLTRMAFQYARKEPKLFKQKLKAEIDNMLKAK